MTYTPTPYELGRFARYDGELFSANPMPNGSKDKAAWEDGWLEADIEIAIEEGEFWNDNF